MGILAFHELYKVEAQPGMRIIVGPNIFWPRREDLAEKKFFAEFDGLVIPECRAAELALYKVKAQAIDVFIFEELREKTEISVSQLIAVHGGNRPGKLTPHFVSYVRGRDGSLWSVKSLWNSVAQDWFFSSARPIVEKREPLNPGEWVVSRANH